MDVLSDQGYKDTPLQIREFSSDEQSELLELLLLRVIPVAQRHWVFLHGVDGLFCLRTPLDHGDGCNNLARMIEHPLVPRRCRFARCASIILVAVLELLRECLFHHVLHPAQPSHHVIASLDLFEEGHDLSFL